MKKGLKWFLIVVLVVVFAIDLWGLYKYKLRGTKYNLSSTGESDAAMPEEDYAPQETPQNPEINYTELKSKDMKSGDKIFITNISSESGNDTYTIKGLIYEQYSITKEEYTNLKSGKTTINIFGNEYKKDTIDSNNLKLKSENENADMFYIKYDSNSKKYILIDSKNDYVVYKTTENYVKIDVSGDLSFSIEKAGKTNKQTVSKVANSYNNVELPKSNSKINLCTLTFNQKGICTKIVEKDL